MILYLARQSLWFACMHAHFKCVPFYVLSSISLSRRYSTFTIFMKWVTGLYFVHRHLKCQLLDESLPLGIWSFILRFCSVNLTSNSVFFSVSSDDFKSNLRHWRSSSWFNAVSIWTIYWSLSLIFLLNGSKEAGKVFAKKYEQIKSVSTIS